MSILASSPSQKCEPANLGEQKTAGIGGLGVKCVRQRDTVCQRYSQLLDSDVLQIAKYSESGPIIKITTASIVYIRNI